MYSTLIILYTWLETFVQMTVLAHNTLKLINI